MSEFDEALARAVEDGVARAGLPGAADAVRRGRRRTLRARGRAATLGIAAIGGAVGVTAALGGPASGARPVAAGGLTAAPTTAPTTGRSASAPPSTTESAAVTAHGDGLLAANLWPGYAEAHWTLLLTNPAGPVKAAGSLVEDCHTSTTSFPITGTTTWAAAGDTQNFAEAIETVFSFADEKEAAAFLADARRAGSAPACDQGPRARVHSPGVGTAYGVSWLMHQRNGGSDGPPAVSHSWLVQAGNRVALLNTEMLGADFPDTNDAKVLSDMLRALEK